MKVALIVNSFPTASETFLYNLVLGLEKKGIQVTICALSKNNNVNLYSNSLHQWSGNINYLPVNNKVSTILNSWKIIKKERWNQYS